MATVGIEAEEKFLAYLEDRNHLSALEVESLRTEYKRRRSNDKNITILHLIVHKGHFTREQAQELLEAYNNVANASVVPVAEAPHWRNSTAARAVDDDSDDIGLNTLAPDSEWTDEATANASRPNARITDKVSEPDAGQRPTTLVRKRDDQRPTAKRPAMTTRLPSRKTSRIEDSSAGSAEPDTGKQAAGWSLHDDSDGIGDADKVVPAGTMIAGSQMTIAQVRDEMQLGEGVKLISSKMESSLAEYQPDATPDKKRYIVLQEIARGGMGKVLEVEDTELRRAVALKVLRKELLGRRDVVERFLEEAQITGQLEHPNIVPVHEMGVDGAGNLYFTMKLVEGMSLAEVLLKLREGNRDVHREFPMIKLLDIFLKICEGIAFAHNKGVIHRDLKPANIMVGKFGEVQVMDWGVAKVVGREFTHEHDSGIVVTDRLDYGSIHTVMGSIIGTPSYMSPEQARGDLDEIGPATDIFSLGVMLYEMLSLRSPWTGKSSDEVLEQVRETTPVRPSERNPEIEIPGELERLCLKCLEKDPGDRVETAKELAGNIRNFIEGRRMGSVDYSLVRLAMKWMGKHRKEVTGVAVSLILIVGGILGTFWYMRTVDQQRIVGLNEEARIELDKWKVAADKEEFDTAMVHVDEAREKFYQVLAVEETDEQAIEGLNDVKNIVAKIREMRMDSFRRDERVSSVQRLLTRAAQFDREGDAAILPFDKERNYRESVRLAQSARDLDSDNREAERLIAKGCRKLFPVLFASQKYGLCDIYLTMWEETGLDATEAKVARQRYNTRS
jgi:serine/threonine protein kinase